MRVATTSIDDYLSRLPASSQAAVARARDAIRTALPDAAESISYGVPTWKLHGRPVVYLAGWAQHYSMYPATAGLVERFGGELGPVEYNGKGTLRFPLTVRVPVRLIARLAKFRAAEVEAAQRATTRVARKKR